MKKIMIFGAGQAGSMISNWINGGLELLGFIDNNPDLCGKYKGNKKIYSAKESVKMMPDIIVITVLNKEASEEIQLQLKLLDYKGIIFNINDFYQPLLAMIDKMVDEKFLHEKYRHMAIVEQSPIQLLDKFESYIAPSIKTYDK